MSLKDVKIRLEEEFKKLSFGKGSEIVGNIVDHVDAVIYKFLEEIRKEKEFENEIEERDTQDDKSDFDDDFGLSDTEQGNGV